MQICFATCGSEPALTKDDLLLSRYLLSKDITITPAIWDDVEVNWQAYDAVILRSTWDYHTQIEKFNSWLAKLELLGCTVLNPVSTVKWNQSKKYLAELSLQGITIPPYNFCLQNSSSSLTDILRDKCWDKVVVKPAVSGGSFNTWITTASRAACDEHWFAQMLQDGDVIVQKFMDEVITCGELSLVFFDRKFSHAVIKKVKSGDFRVQAQFGGVSESVFPDGAILRSAMGLLEAIKGPLLYARVDGIISNEQFYLMELELIEPVLFLASDENACENFYRALCRLLPDSGVD